MVDKPSLLTKWVEATFVQLPPSMIRIHTFPWIVHREWKMWSLWFSSLGPSLACKILWRTKSSPTSGVKTVVVSSFSSSSPSSSTSSEARQLISSISLRVSTLLFGQSAWKWPYPWHLKHFRPSNCLGTSLTKVLPLSLFPDSFGVTSDLWTVKGLKGAVGLTGPSKSLFPFGIFLHLNG